MKNKAWVVTVNMGYGHQRTAYPLRRFAIDNKIINANDYDGIPEDDKKTWESSRRFYETISRFKKVPIIGEFAFYLYNKLQEIPSFYPRRDLSKPPFFLKKVFSMIEKGWGKNLITKVRKTPIPFVTSFFITAFMAEKFKYPGDIYCVICDADIARPWASLDSRKSKIKYFCPNSWTRDRLKLYGVKEENIFLTGFPLPIENIGTQEEMEILKEDLRHRIFNLDPKKAYTKRYLHLIDQNLGPLPKVSNHPLTILFSIGGAGAQKEIAIRFVKSLKEKILKGELKVILGAGIREGVRDYFWESIERLGLKSVLDKNVEILFDKNISKYFEMFNKKLRQTDILWTKPSELSFYSGLGVPIMIAPSVGSQEDLNRKWLLRTGSGIVQENPRYVKQWLFDYLNSGRFAEAAMDGFIKIEKRGVYKIGEIIK